MANNFDLAARLGQAQGRQKRLDTGLGILMGLSNQAQDQVVRNQDRAAQIGQAHAQRVERQRQEEEEEERARQKEATRVRERSEYIAFVDRKEAEKRRQTEARVARQTKAREEDVKFRKERADATDRRAVEKKVAADKRATTKVEEDKNKREEAIKRRAMANVMKSQEIKLADVANLTPEELTERDEQIKTAYKKMLAEERRKEKEVDPTYEAPLETDDYRDDETSGRPGPGGSGEHIVEDFDERSNDELFKEGLKKANDRDFEEGLKRAQEKEKEPAFIETYPQNIMTKLRGTRRISQADVETRKAIDSYPWAASWDPRVAGGDIKVATKDDIERVKRKRKKAGSFIDVYEGGSETPSEEVFPKGKGAPGGPGEESLEYEPPPEDIRRIYEEINRKRNDNSIFEEFGGDPRESIDEARRLEEEERKKAAEGIGEGEDEELVAKLQDIYRRGTSGGRVTDEEARLAYQYGLPGFPEPDQPLQPDLSVTLGAGGLLAGAGAGLASGGILGALRGSATDLGANLLTTPGSELGAAVGEDVGKRIQGDELGTVLGTLGGVAGGAGSMVGARKILKGLQGTPKGHPERGSVYIGGDDALPDDFRKMSDDQLKQYYDQIKKDAPEDLLRDVYEEIQMRQAQARKQMGISNMIEDFVRQGDLASANNALLVYKKDLDPKTFAYYQVQLHKLKPRGPVEPGDIDELTKSAEAAELPPDRRIGPASTEAIEKVSPPPPPMAVEIDNPKVPLKDVDVESLLTDPKYKRLWENRESGAASVGGGYKWDDLHDLVNAKITGIKEKGDLYKLIDIGQRAEQVGHVDIANKVHDHLQNYFKLPKPEKVEFYRDPITGQKKPSFNRPLEDLRQKELYPEPPPIVKGLPKKSQIGYEQTPVPLEGANAKETQILKEAFESDPSIIKKQIALEHEMREGGGLFSPESRSVLEKLQKDRFRNSFGTLDPSNMKEVTPEVYHLYQPERAKAETNINSTLQRMNNAGVYKYKPNSVESVKIQGQLTGEVPITDPLALKLATEVENLYNANGGMTYKQFVDHYRDIGEALESPRLAKMSGDSVSMTRKYIEYSYKHKYEEPVIEYIKEKLRPLYSKNQQEYFDRWYDKNIKGRLLPPGEMVDQLLEGTSRLPGMGWVKGDRAARLYMEAKRNLIDNIITGNSSVWISNIGTGMANVAREASKNFFKGTYLALTNFKRTMKVLNQAGIARLSMVPYGKSTLYQAIKKNITDWVGAPLNAIAHTAQGIIYQDAYISATKTLSKYGYKGQRLNDAAKRVAFHAASRAQNIEVAWAKAPIFTDSLMARMYEFFQPPIQDLGTFARSTLPQAGRALKNKDITGLFPMARQALATGLAYSIASSLGLDSKKLLYQMLPGIGLMDPKNLGSDAPLTETINNVYYALMEIGGPEEQRTEQRIKNAIRSIVYITNPFGGGAQAERIYSALNPNDVIGDTRITLSTTETIKRLFYRTQRQVAEGRFRIAKRIKDPRERARVERESLEEIRRNQ